MTAPNYPLSFEPIFKNMLWGGRRLPGFLNRPAPSADPVGEAWVLSDVDGSLSTIANGPLAGRTLRDVAAAHPRELYGENVPRGGRFPLLLKFIDAAQELSVQVHPDDERAARLEHPDKRGKTEAWVILDADPATSKVYAGFRPGVTPADFRAAMTSKTTQHTLHSYTPTPGDCLFLRAGVVHAVGANILLFEVQQTSDITYRLYDWDRVDAKTKKPRDLHIDKGLECSDFAAGPCHPVAPAWSGRRERLVDCEHFTLHRVTDGSLFPVGAAGACRAVVGTAGRGELVWSGGRVPIETGSVLLLPAAVGVCTIEPSGTMTVLECSHG
ncbi:type I phosphomannose isomerase catalytic subunit [Fimbriiglobus ruber]|uniref:Mannose-6-phosphate isomerase n=1 Tax=Fimbriiglobus ruber TaxID=1908690 RepID=A0A225DGU3_9BACT|nr:type I phosphomannose isomerase catalytic subunit [Fimbriiglobus ruber]OWK35615.1 Mannose-6-phosphate isomerase [Fimbriiglobus ruber]